MEYFKQNESLYHLCYIPFILSVLVCIAKEYDELPSNRVEVYKKFVIFTISRFLKRSEGSDHTVSTIDELPVEYKSYLLELSKYAFNALEINQSSLIKINATLLILTNFVAKVKKASAGIKHSYI